MQITVQFETQLKRAAGVGTETIELAPGSTLHEAVRQVASPAREPLRKLLIGADGGVLPTVLLFVNDQQVDVTREAPLEEGDTVTVMSPISGG